MCARSSCRLGARMLNRQKSLLYMIEQAGRPVQHLELTKWSFLLANEMPSRGGRSFYQFVPYRLGPFSFCLYQEVDALVHNGYLAGTEVGEQQAWQLVDDVEPPTGSLTRTLQDDISRIVERFRDAPPDALLDYVYEHFPWFTVNSVRTKLDAKPVAAPAVYTVGYEGWLVDGFLNLLIRQGIERVLDVRSNPVSRRYGFHGGTFSRLCSSLGIEYRDFPQLGIPPRHRRELGSLGDYEALFLRYEQGILKSQSAALDSVAVLMIGKPSALMCMETDPLRCHRGRLAQSIAQRTGLRVQHLGVAYEGGV